MLCRIFENCNNVALWAATMIQVLFEQSNDLQAKYCTCPLTVQLSELLSLNENSIYVLHDPQLINL